MVEERVGGDFDFVEVDARVVGIHANRRGVADEMDVVAAGGQFHAEFGGNDSGAAVGGIASDADAHMGCSASPLMRRARYDTTVSIAEARICEIQKYGSEDRKSTRLNSSHVRISYAVFCLKKKKI